MQKPVATQAEAPSTAPTQAKQPSVRKLLIRLIVVCLLPSIFALGLWIHAGQQAQRQNLENDSLRIADAKVQAIDEKLTKNELFVEALASSESLKQRDFSAFHHRSVNLLRELNTRLTVVLFTIDGQQLINTSVPYGQPLPKRQDTKDIETVVRTGRGLSHNLRLRQTDGSPVVVTMAPVFDGTKVAYVLATGFSTDQFDPLFRSFDLDAGIAATIVDRDSKITASTQGSSELTGEKSSLKLLQSRQFLNRLNGFVETRSLVGVPIFSVYSISPTTGWGMVIDIPREYLEGPQRRSNLIFLLGAALILTFSLGLAWRVSSRITNSVQALRNAAGLLGSDSIVEMPPSSLAEIDELSHALSTSGRLLTRRTQELMVANKTLLERSIELSEAQHIAKIGNWKWDGKTDIHVASDELHRVYGSAILQPFTKHRGTIYSEETWQTLNAAAIATLKNKTSFSLALPTMTATGTEIWTRVIGEVVCSATGEVIGLRGTLQDIDVYIKAEMAVQESAKGYRTLFNGSPEAIIVHRNGVLAFANLSAVKLFAASAESDLIGVSMSQLVHADFQAISAARTLQVSQPGATNPPLELTLITTQGLPFSAEVQSAELMFEGTSFIQTYVHDLTERKGHEKELANLQSEMQYILAWQVAQHTVAALAHEINQPLASASILCEAANRLLLTHGLPDTARAEQGKRLEQTLHRINDDIERAGTVLKNLLKSVSQPDTTRAPATINSLVAESIQSAREEGVFGYQIITDYAADLPAIMVNRLKVIKVLLNLIHNGAHAMHGVQSSDGKIWISTALAADGNSICVSVRDDGPGISPALQQEVFQPFITTKPRGLGMGLTISRALIQANNGELWHTQVQGRGAAFHFTLPILS